MDSLPWPEAIEPPPALSSAIRAQCTSDLVPKTPPHPWRRLVRSIITSGVLFVTLLAVGWTRHPPESAIGLALVGAVVWGVVQGAVLFVGYGSPPGRRAKRIARWGFIGLVLASFVAHLSLAARTRLSIPEFASVHHSVRGTVVCGVHSLIFGLMAMSVLFYLWRRTDPFSPRLTGAVTGLAGGLVGAVALDMTCPTLEAWHLWLGHGLTLGLMVAAGWSLGRRWLAP